MGRFQSPFQFTYKKTNFVKKYKPIPRILCISGITKLVNVPRGLLQCDEKMESGDLRFPRLEVSRKKLL